MRIGNSGEHRIVQFLRPTDRRLEGFIEAFGEFSGSVDTHLERLREVIDSDLDEFGDLVSELDLPPIVPTS